jgi:hypothetical protein
MLVSLSIDTRMTVQLTEMLLEESSHLESEYLTVTGRESRCCFVCAKACWKTIQYFGISCNDKDRRLSTKRGVRVVISVIPIILSG